ncbi:hypothetical protein F5Y18DRAFT_362573 [Xylariaceae sp. FL1019]|nr:hypothetical protein F5Y18DRAFT_362573 [Xylariaceae sp. FL1019]
MLSAISPNFVLPPVSRQDLTVDSIAFGFTLGFGWLTVCTAIRQTWVAYRRLGRRIFHNAYIWMIWAEIIVCLIFSFICFLYIKGIIPPSLPFYFAIVTTWALQVQFLLQIIINRCGLVVADKRFIRRLKIGVAVLITAINISVYTIWIPARLQISETYIHTNHWWDRCEKVIYAITDGCLNIYFIRLVQKRLVQNGLEKYRRLANFNILIIGFSLSMDVIIIGIMSLSNTFVYMQIHPLAYIVKLKIEMSMAELIGIIARKKKPCSNLNAVNNIAGTDGPVPRSSQANSTSPILNRRQSSCPQYGSRGTAERLANIPDDIIRPNAVYSVGCTSDGATGPAFHSQNNIHTTREVHVESEKASDQLWQDVDPNLAPNRDDELTSPSTSPEWDVTDESPVIHQWTREF